MFFPILISSLLSLSVTEDHILNGPGQPADGKPVISASYSLNKTYMLGLINQVRRKGCKCGDTYYYPAPELLWSDQLEQAALVHSTDMLRNQYLAHIAPDGTNGGARIEKAGYNWRTYGENIAEGYETEREVVEAWLQSPRHCKNIMNPAFREVGVARSGKYWTQEFASK